MVIAYDGTAFGGWQVQPNAVTIQQLLEEKLSTILQMPTSVVGAGRTDAGVHALGQCAHFIIPKPIDTARTLHSFNGMLPEAIRVFSLKMAPSGFHARYSAKKKHYHYHLTLDSVQSPFDRHYKLHVRQKLDLKKMEQGARHLLGTHDFRAFANDAHLGSSGKNPIRTIERLQIVPEAGGVRLEFEGESFLYKMVRNCVGTLLDVGLGKLEPDNMAEILASRDRKQAGRAAPAHGLFLVRIEY